MDQLSTSFFVFNDTAKKLTFFTLIDIVMLLIWIFLVFGYAFYKVSKNREISYYDMYMKHLLYKVGFAFIFAFYYIFYVGGGDSIAFWDMAGCMNKLFFKSPEIYFNNLFYNFRTVGFIDQYDVTTGAPPRWIMTESESFFVAKIVSLFSFFTAGSYLVITLLFATITTSVTWRLYETILKIFPDPNKWITYSMLFVPSLCFWCTGISKDTLVIISIFSIANHGFRLLMGIQKSKFLSLCILLFHVWMIFNLRSVVLITLLLPFFIALSMRIANRYKSNIIIKRIIQLFIATVSAGGFFIGIQSYGDQVSVEKYIKEAEVQTQDFMTNKLYTGKKYSIEITDYSPIGILKVFPQALAAGLFRPYIWEALSVSLFLNGLESMAILYLLYRFFTRRRKARIKMIRENEFLVFSFFFVILLGYITGFSSVIFGVLVRLRAPLLPFLGILLTIEPPKEEEIEGVRNKEITFERQNKIAFNEKK